MAKKRVQRDDSDDEQDSGNRGGNQATAKKAPEKWNWTAIAIMLMFLLPGAIAVFFQVFFKQLTNHTFTHKLLIKYDFALYFLEKDFRHVLPRGEGPPRNQGQSHHVL